MRKILCTDKGWRDPHFLVLRGQKKASASQEWMHTSSNRRVLTYRFTTSARVYLENTSWNRNTSLSSRLFQRIRLPCTSAIKFGFEIKFNHKHYEIIDARHRALHMTSETAVRARCSLVIWSDWVRTQRVIERNLPWRPHPIASSFRISDPLEGAKISTGPTTTEEEALPDL